MEDSGSSGDENNGPTRENRFNGAPLEDVEKFFYQLVKNKEGTPYLTQDQFDEFIQRAFEEKPFVNEIALNGTRNRKEKIIGLFHLFYEANVVHRQGIGKYDPNANVDRYIRLLTDHFGNWAFDEVRDNFRRGGGWEPFPTGR